MCSPVGTNSRFSPSLSSVPSAANCVGTYLPKFSSVVLTHSQAARGIPEESVMFNPDAHMPRINRGMVYLGACLIAGIRLAREQQVNVRVVPTGKAIEESVDLAYEIYNRVFRKMPEKVR